MGLFKSILDKLGIGKKDEEAAETKAAAVATPAKPEAAAPKPAVAATPKPAAAAAPKSAMSAPADVAHQAATRASAVPAKPAPMDMVDVVSKLEALAAAGPKGLDWKVSIVDLLKLLGIDSSYEARKELATELGCPAELMGESAKMNTWLHKTVLQKIAENGGNIPQELLD